MISTRKDNEVMIVCPQFDRLDSSSTISFKSKLQEIINNGDKLIVLNLENIKFVDSTGLGSIVSVIKLLSKEGDLLLCCIDEIIMSMFRLTRMDRVFKICETEEEAIKNVWK